MTHDEIYQKLKEVITQYLRLEKDEVQPQSHMVNDLNADSLALVEIGFQFSEIFGIGMLEPTQDNMIIGTLAEQIFQQMHNACGVAECQSR